MPMTRSRGKPLASSATWHIASKGFATIDQDGVGRVLDDLFGHAAHDVLVGLEQVVAAHARLAGAAAGNDDHVGAGGLLVAVGPVTLES